MGEGNPKLVRRDALRLHMERRGEMVTDATIFASERIELEKDAVRQLADAASLPPARKVLATADIHVGFGIPIGCVMGMEDAIMPPAVGYDINCGMRLLRTPFEKGQIDTDKVAIDIACDIPLGEGKENLVLGKAALDEVIHNGVAGLPAIVRKTSHRAWEVFDPEEFARDMSRIEDRGSLAGEAGAVPSEAVVKGANQIGTLGGGNHFIEIQHVQEVFDKALAREFGLSANQIVVMVHSGSRRFGYEIADQYMNVAAGHGVNSGRGKMLSYLPTEDKKGTAYIGAMSAAANFAYVNRHVMGLLVRRCFNRMFGPTPLDLVYDVTHNMAKLETHEGRKLWVHRKGATRAFGPDRMSGTVFGRIGQPIITPGSMGTASFLLVGTGKSGESLCSVNHGAGRVMSRSAALGKMRRGRVVKPGLISDDEFQRSMKGIKLIAGNKSKIREEAPGAYKDIEEVVRIVVECGWARPVARMVPLAVLKG